MAVDDSRFDPIGERGLPPYVRASGYTSDLDYTDQQNETVAVIVHIEGKRRNDNVEEIVEAERSGILFSGPYGQPQSLEIPSQVCDERVEELMGEVCEKAVDRDVGGGAYADGPVDCPAMNRRRRPVRDGQSRRGATDRATG